MRRKILVILFLILLIVAAFVFYTRYKNQPPKDTLILYGNVDVRQVDIGFRVMGRVKELKFEEGDHVVAGDLMAVLDNQPYQDLVNQAQADVAATHVSYGLAEKVLKRRQELVGDGSVSQEDLENAMSSKETLQANLEQVKAALGVAKTNFSDTEVFAPNEGVILTRIKEPGSVVNVSEPVYTLTLTNPIWIRAYVSEPDLGNIYQGMPAEIYTDTPNSPVYQGHIGFISPVAEFTPKTVETAQLRTDLVYRLRVITDNPDHLLKQGMPVTVRLKLNEHR